MAARNPDRGYSIVAAKDIDDAVDMAKGLPDAGLSRRTCESSR